MKYNYTCGLKNGKIINGSVNSNSKKEAIEFLTNKGYSLLSITRDNKRFKTKHNQKFILIFTKMFSSLIKAGLSISESLEILYSQVESKELKKLMEELIKEIRSGFSLADALRKHPNYFNDYYCSIVEAGEQSGFLYETFNNLYVYILNKNKFKKKLIMNLTYPIFLSVFSIIVILFLSIFVLPSFAKIYESFDKELPLLTSIVLSFSEFIKSNLYILFFLFLGLFLLISDLLKDSSRREKVDLILLKSKTLKKYIYIKNINSFFTILSLSLKSGMDIISALNISNKAVTNVKIKNDLASATRSVIKGERLSKALNNIDFPIMSVQMINAGENSNDLEEMLNEVVEIYQYELDQSLSLLTSFLEPILIIIIGAMIGVIIIALVLPILTLSSAIN